MRDKHFVVAMIVLVLPLSFGVGTTAGTKAAGALADAEANHFQSLSKTTAGSHGFTTADVPGQFSTSDTGFDIASALQVREFVSSFDTSVTRGDVTCGHPANRNGDCFTGYDGARSASGFPMYDSFNSSERSEYSRSTGNAWLIGSGSGGGGGGGAIGPKPTKVTDPIVTPEPGTLALLGLGLLGIAAFARRRGPRFTA